MTTATFADVFGPLVTGYDVQRAMIAHLRKWLPTYLLFGAEHSGRAHFSLPLIRSWTTTPREPERWSEDQLPACLLVSPGLVGQPVESGDGDVRATWNLALAVIVSTAQEEITHELAALYGGLIRLILLQRPSLGGFADGTSITGEAYDILPRETARNLAAASIACEVEVSAIGNRERGFPFPWADPLDSGEEWADPINDPLITAEEYLARIEVTADAWPILETDHIEAEHT